MHSFPVLALGCPVDGALGATGDFERPRLLGTGIRLAVHGREELSSKLSALAQGELTCLLEEVGYRGMHGDSLAYRGNLGDGLAPRSVAALCRRPPRRYLPFLRSTILSRRPSSTSAPPCRPLVIFSWSGAWSSVSSRKR